MSLERTEYNYHAMAMIFGEKSPHTRKLSVYSIDVLKQHNDLLFSECEGLTSENRLNVSRHLQVDVSRHFETDQAVMASEIAQRLSYSDVAHDIYACDMLFEESDFPRLDEEGYIVRKISNLGTLIQSVHEHHLIEIPLLINEFPKITCELLRHPYYWISEEDRKMINEIKRKR